MLTVRTRTEIDVDTVISWVPDPAALYLFAGTQLSWPLSRDQLIGLEVTPGYSAWVAVDPQTGGMAGHFDLNRQKRDFRISRVIIDPGRRGQGLASKLITVAADKARELGAARLTLNVIIDNIPAIRTYEAVGFTALPIAERTGVISMSLDLPPNGTHGPELIVRALPTLPDGQPPRDRRPD